MRLVRSAPGAGKTSVILREFKEALSAGRKDLRIVVPTATLVRHFQHELARDGVVFPPSMIVSLNRYAAECAPGLRQVPAGLLRAIVRDTLRRLCPAEFAEVAHAEGMADTLAETITLFENADLTPERLGAVRRMNAQAKAFQKLWAAIESAISQAGFQTRAGILRAAAASPVASARIWLDGFQNLSAIEERFVAALDKTCEVTLTLNNVRASDEIYRFALATGAQDRLLQGPARKPSLEGAAASTVEREADEIARRILHLHDRGLDFREIGVALREPTVYLPLLRATFDRFGIPARFHFSESLSGHPASTFLSGLIECVLNGWEFTGALETLQAHAAWGQSSAFDRFDFKVREVMPGSGAATLLSLAEPDFAKRIAPCFTLDAWRDEQLSPRDWAARFAQMARSLYRPGLIEPARDHVSLAPARSLSAAQTAWSDAVDTAAAFWPEPQSPVALQDFWNVAREVIEGSALQMPDDRRDVVNVMSAFEARQWDVSTLFVCGFTDRDFPRRNPQNLIFPDHEIDTLRLPIRKGSDRDKEETFLWDALKTRARDCLILTWPEHDAAGNTVQSSRYLSDLGVVAEPVTPCRATPPFSFEGVGRAGSISSPELLPALAAHHPSLSLSSLEDMVQCRFRFFAGRTLSLKPRPERPDERLQKRISGLILHSALEAWLNNLRQGDFVDFFETAFDDMVREKHLPQGFRLEMERILLRETARNVNATEQWTPASSQAEVELSIGYPGGVKVTCRVDRIDRMNDSDCVIVDYKSGRTANVEKLILSKVKLQGPLYALAVQEQLNLRTIAMMYVAVREDLHFGWGGVPGAKLDLLSIPENWMEDAYNRSSERLASFLSGAVQAEPTEEEGCRWCDYKQACRIEERERKTLVMIGGAGA